MTPTGKALEYAQTHLQAVRICWIDHTVTVCDAIEAVAQCSDGLLTGRIIRVIAQDKKFENMLNQLIDGRRKRPD